MDAAAAGAKQHSLRCGGETELPDDSANGDSFRLPCSSSFLGSPSSVGTLGRTSGNGPLLCLSLGSEHRDHFETSLDTFMVCKTQPQERL